MKKALFNEQVRPMNSFVQGPFIDFGWLPGRFVAVDADSSQVTCDYDVSA